jgi:uncharacterized membrane protein YdbT with pleckstrin-like domain
VLARLPKFTDRINLMTKATNTPQKYFEDQFDDEEVLYVFHKHPIVMRKGLVLAMLGPLLGILPSYFKPSLGFGYFFGGLLVGILVGALLLLPSWIGWHFSVFIVTDQRFIQIIQKGFFNRSVADISLSQIQSVNYEIKGLQETLLGFGTIKIQTYVGDLTVHDVSHPSKVQKRLLNILRKEGLTTVQYPATQHPNNLHEETEIQEE